MRTVVSRYGGQRCQTCRTPVAARHAAPGGGERDAIETRVQTRWPRHSRRSKPVQPDSRERSPEPCIYSSAASEVRSRCRRHSASRSVSGPLLHPGDGSARAGLRRREDDAAGSRTSAGRSSLARAASRISRWRCSSTSAARRSRCASVAPISVSSISTGPRLRSASPAAAALISWRGRAGGRCSAAERAVTRIWLGARMDAAGWRDCR
jgi:hypothetical protein